MPRLPFAATANEIAQWVPDCFSDIVGNRSLVKYCRNALAVEGKVPPSFVGGDPRTGKTAAVKLTVNTLFCERTDATSDGPCLQCNTCKNNVAKYGELGIDAEIRVDKKAAGRTMTLHFVPIDCTQHTESSLRDKMIELKDFDDGLRIVYLDELHRLGRRNLDELLLKPMDEKNFAWWASSATTQGLDPMLLNRFCVRIRTEPPTHAELAEWLARRCQAWLLEWDKPETLILLADRSNLTPGLALHVLAWAAATPARMVTEAMVTAQDFGKG